MKRAQLYLILLIVVVAVVLAIYQRTTENDEATLTSENEETVSESATDEQETPRLLKLNGDTLEVYEPLVSSEPIATIAEPVGKNENVETYRVIGDHIYYQQMKDGYITVARMNFAGEEELFEFTQIDFNKGESMDGFAVSSDETKVAWTTQQMFEGVQGFVIEAKLWVADLEEGIATNTHSVSFENQEAYLLPVRWTDDGSTIFFSEQRSGLGGYILFSGWHDLYSKNLETGAIVQLARNVYDIAPNETMLSLVGTEAGVDLVALVNGEADYFFPLPSEEGFFRAGNVMFSPDGTKIAYNIAAGNPDEEKYRVIVSEIGGSEETIVINSNSFFPNVVRWLDNETLLLADSAGYYIANIDGSWNAF